MTETTTRTRRLLGGDGKPLLGGECVTLDYYARLSGDRDGLALLARLAGRKERDVIRMGREQLVGHLSEADRLYHALHVEAIP